MKLLKKSLALLLAMVLTLGAFSSLKAEAKEITIKTPKITSVKLIKNDAGIKVAVGKTKDAEGYEVYVSYEAADNSLYQDDKDVYANYKEILSYKHMTDIEQSGSKKRTVSIKLDDFIKAGMTNKNLKTLPAGKYTVTVRSYNKKKYGTTVWSEYSKEKSTTVALEKTGKGYKSSYDFSKAKKGDIITFGAYEQDGNLANGQEPIEWVVLSKTKSQLFVVSKFALDAVPYNDKNTGDTWETCTLRKWLNEKFYNAAFNKDEKALIKTTTVENFDNPKYKTPGGNDTKDKVFLLSQLEMIDSDLGFSEEYETYDVNRRCAPTNYAVARGAYAYTGTDEEYKTKSGEGACDWWLRSPGSYADFAASVLNYGYVHSFGFYVLDDSNGVRPALIINLK